MRIPFKSPKSLAISLILTGLVGSIILISKQAHAEPDALKRARGLQAAGKPTDALNLLTEAVKSEKNAEDRALMLFALADLTVAQGRLAEAKGIYEQSLAQGTRLGDYARFALGQLHEKLNDPASARKRFEEVLSSSTATVMQQLDARSEIADQAIIEKQWVLARKHLVFLQRRQKFTQRYPDVVYQLLRVDLAQGNSRSACRWATELYSKYPTHGAVNDWTMELAKAKVDGRALGCSVSLEEKRTRIKRLQWAGASDRALSELKLLQAQAPELGQFALDSLMANHLLNEGSTDDALKLLIKHYDGRKSDSGFLMQLGRAASRAGEYQTAVAAYYRAYQVAPRGKNGKTALFQAAFMSYQGQDYDGASRKFEEFIKAFPRSGLSRDSQWHMAWIRYLKRDYQGALVAFDKLGAPTYKKTRRGRKVRMAPETGSADRIQYWTAMSLLKLGRTAEAKAKFEKLARDPGFGYYGMVAYYRLQTIDAPAAVQLAKSDEGRTLATAGTTVAMVNGELSAEAPSSPEAVAEEEESEESIAGEEKMANDSDVAVGDGEVGVADEKMLSAQFNDPKLSSRFERARDLMAIGRTDLARQELFEVERRARSASDRRKLMGEYQQVENYHRASYISEIGFGAERIRGGMQTSRHLWEYAFPRAYEKNVLASSAAFNVPHEFVWAIMRAESQYRQEALSPVGAMGLMQMMPFTGRRVADLLSQSNFEPRSLLEPANNIRFGTRYLQRLQEKFNGAIPLSAAAYNAGPHRVNSWLKSFGTLDMDEFIEHIPFVETRNYVKKVSRNYQIYSMLYNSKSANGGRNMAWLIKPVGVKPGAATNENW